MTRRAPGPYAAPTILTLLLGVWVAAPSESGGSMPVTGGTFRARDLPRLEVPKR